MSQYLTANLRFTAETFRELRYQAGRRGTTVAALVREAVDAEVPRGALARMGRLADKRLSLTDCATFELMDRLGLRSAFSFIATSGTGGDEMLP
ncbi:MAG: hypothetical protein ACRELA_20995 [Candidatus Rokuibacteriota bacterium]